MAKNLSRTKIGNLAYRDETPAEPIPSATVLLIKDSQNTKGIEVFLLERASSSTFGGAFVFPGGKIDTEDYSDQIAKSTAGLTDIKASSLLGLSSGGLAYWIACIRECFEETGMLLAYDSDSTILQPSDEAKNKRFSAYRKRLNSGEPIFAEMCSTEAISLAADKLAYLSHWITPKSIQKRYTTRFFIAIAPYGQNTLHDGSEIVNSFWIQPEKALQRNRDGNLPMILPTRRSLQQVCGYRTAVELFEEKSNIHPSTIQSVEPILS